MACAILEVESRSFPLKSGTYLLRGGEALDEKAEHSLFIGNASIDDKHAMIIAGFDGVYVYDLDTRLGTFVDEQRLTPLSKYTIAGDVSIRFGTVKGKLRKCSTLEQRDSSGFHDESLRLVLDQTTEAVNLTIPETQCVNPDESVYACESKNDKNASNDVSIPETQEVLQLMASEVHESPSTAIHQATITSDNAEEQSQFRISTQDFNDCLDGASDSDSRDFLENINWLIGDEQHTAIKQTIKSTKVDEQQNTTEGNESNRAHIDTTNEKDTTASFETADNEQDSSRSQTNTPDLFDNPLLADLEMREARLISAKAKRAQKDKSTTEKNEETEDTEDASNDERTQTVSEKLLVAAPVLDEAAKTLENSTTTQGNGHEDADGDAPQNPAIVENKGTINPKSINQVEADLFEGEMLDNDNLADTPLQHSNKENMHIGTVALADLEPTQVFVAKKAMKPPETVTPARATPPHSSLFGSDFEPTQVFQPKKAKHEGSFKPPAPIISTAPIDEKDLEPTQIFVPKKSSCKSDAKTENETMALNSTMVSSTQKESEKLTVKSFFATVDSSLQDVPRSSSTKSPKHLSPLRPAHIMLTPELISTAFAEQKPPNTASRLEMIRRLDFCEENEDALTVLLNSKRERTDFDSLIDSIRQVEESPTKKQGKWEKELLRKYISTQKSETPKKKRKLEYEPIELDNADDPTTSTSTRQNTDRDVIDDQASHNEHLKTKKNEKEEVSDAKISSKRGRKKTEVETKSNESKEEHRRQKRTAIVDASDEVDSKKMKKVSSTKTEESSAETKVADHAERRLRNSSKPTSAGTVDEAIEPNSKHNKAKKYSTRSKESGTSTQAAGITASNLKSSTAGTSETKKEDHTEKRLRHQTSKSSSTTSRDKATEENSKNKHAKSKPTKGKESSKSSTAREKAVDNTKTSTENSEKAEPAIRLKRSRKISNSSSSTVATKNSASSDRNEDRDISLRTSTRLKSQSSCSTVYSIAEYDKNSDEKHSQIGKPSASGRSKRLATIDSLMDAVTCSSSNSTKDTKAGKMKSDSRKHENELKNTLNSSVTELHGKRTRSRAPSTVVPSQEVKNKNAVKAEMPTTSRPTAKHTANLEEKSDKKSILKLAFTMVEPTKKEELLENANDKWEEARNIADSEILVMDTGNRTLKFLIAVAKGIPIVTTKWLEASKATGIIAVRSNYFFKDAAFERSFKFSLLNTLSKAKNAKLFTNFQFLLTDNIVPQPQDMKMVITCAGGVILEKENIPREKDNQQLYLISSEKDRQHWHSYRRKNSNLCITNTEAVMLAIMRYDFEVLKKRSF